MRFLFIPVVVLFSCSLANGQQPTGQELIATFRKAIGASGPAVSTPFIIKYRGQRHLYSLVDGKLKGQSFDFEAAMTGHTDTPQKQHTEFVMKIGVVPFKHVEVVDGESGWFQINDGDAVAMSKNLIQGKRQRDIHVTVFLGRESFDSANWQFSEPKSTVVRGQEAWECQAKTSGLEPLTLSFSKQSGLLLRLETKAVDYELLPGADAKVNSFTRELQFSDWKKFGNRMLPGHLDVFHDGVLWAQMEPVGISLPKTLDEGLFVMPKPKK